MSEFSDFYENKIIDHLLRAVAYTPPATIYTALFTGVTGLEANNPSLEVAGGAYTRQTTTLSAASGGTTSNPSDITWTTASASWGTVTHVALVDHQTNVTWGTNVNVLMWSALDTEKWVDTNDTFKINAQQLGVTVA